MDRKNNINETVKDKLGLSYEMDDRDYIINSEHKSRLFSFIFGREETKERTLALYNSLSGTNYVNTDDITITTIDDVVYMGMKNDLSYIVMDRASLYSVLNINEHQSTDNPNIPIREFMYAARLYDKYLKTNKKNPYSSKIIPLPIPKLVVLYNGKSDVPDEMILSLSDAFKEEIRRTLITNPGYSDYDKDEIEKEVNAILKNSDPDIEVRVRMININYGHSSELLSRCEPLYEYSWLIDRIRSNVNSGMGIGPATDDAVVKMPDNYELKEQLMAHRAEVVGMWINEYNEKETMQMFKEEGREEGREEGWEECREELISGMLKRGKTPEAISEFCGIPVDYIKQVQKEICVSE